jgi:hypothetical protein
MGDCTFCGKPAGWFREKHKECEAKHQAGSEEIATLAQTAIKSGGDLSALEARAREVATASFVEESTVPALLQEGWENAVTVALEDTLISASEESALERALTHFGWKQQDLDRNGAYSNLVKGGTLRDVVEGKIPTRFQVDGTLPFNFQKDEQLIWLFPGAKYYEVRSRRSYTGGYQGVSVRIARGLYYRVGGFRGHPIETSESVHADTGVLGITQKQFYFAGPVKAFRVRYDKIVSFTPYEDGIGFQRDAATAKPQAFQTGDGWFTYNLVMNLAKLQAGRGVVAPHATVSVVEEAPDTERDDEFSLPIVGESHYQEALEAVCGGRDEDGVDRVLDACLTLEDSNPYDPQAVRVDIGGKTVGYLSRDDARRFRQKRAEDSQTADTTPCKARVKGGWDRGADDRGNFGVWLNISL